MTNLTLQPIMDQARIPRSEAAWRVVVGEVAEELAAERLNGRRLNTGAGWYCPDIETNDFYGEVKAVGMSRHVIIYSMRLAKDRRFVTMSRKPLCYVLVLHDFTVPDSGMAMDTARFAIQFSARLWVIPFCYVDAICSVSRPKVINRKYIENHGACRNGYENGGYYIPVKRLTQACPHGRVM